ncbi:hypothetical protein DFAR_850021 [Desulfarculales bacterium]
MKGSRFLQITWRHLNLFQHHRYVTVRVPWVDCLDHGAKQIKMPWTREGSRLTLLFEQAAITLVQEMPVLAAARIIGVSDTRLWRVIWFYVTQTLSKMDLGGVKAVALDETVSKRGYNYITVFIDLDRKRKPVIFVIPGKGIGCLVLCSAASCVSMAMIRIISPRWSATCRQPPWPQSAKASPAPTSPWIGSM